MKERETRSLYKILGVHGPPSSISEAKQNDEIASKFPQLEAHIPYQEPIHVTELVGLMAVIGLTTVGTLLKPSKSAEASVK